MSEDIARADTETTAWHCRHRSAPSGGLTAAALGAYVPAPEARVSPVQDDVEPEGNGARALGGMEIPIKDNIDVAGWPTRAASEASHADLAAGDAEVVKRLRRGGATTTLKTALDEFAFTTAGGGMRNPHDPSRIVGGSSGGAALAVAAGGHCVALGTDTGGSVRIPASYCGVVGFKPSYGLIPLDGVVPLSWSLDHIGLLGCSVGTVTRVFDVCRNQRAAARPATGRTLDTARAWPRSWRELRVGIPEASYLSAAVAPVEAALARVSDLLSAHEASVSVVSLPPIETVLPIHYCLVMAEAATYHAQQYDDFALHGSTVRGAIEAGLELSARDYVSAAQGREQLRLQLATVFSDVDVVALPTTTTPAPPIDASDVELGDGRLVSQLDASIWYTSTFNDVGMPAISLPMPSDGLPVGVQLAAINGDDDLLLSVASSVERWLTEQQGASSKG
jgi:aspartyl-tRNA(Asn)/glutamyl-tRNA(Gln) amidotransferase subunit A